MKNMKVLILVFGILGVISLFIPMGDGIPSMFSLFMELDKVQIILMLAAFGLPAVMGAMGLAKPPFQMWQAVVALAGFALAAVKTKIWEALPHIMDQPLPGKLMVIATVGGVIVSALALAKPEGKA